MGTNDFTKTQSMSQFDLIQSLEKILRLRLMVWCSKDQQDIHSDFIRTVLLETFGWLTIRHALKVSEHCSIDWHVRETVDQIFPQVSIYCHRWLNKNLKSTTSSKPLYLSITESFLPGWWWTLFSSIYKLLKYLCFWVFLFAKNEDQPSKIWFIVHLFDASKKANFLHCYTTKTKRTADRFSGLRHWGGQWLKIMTFVWLMVLMRYLDFNLHSIC